MAELLTGHRSTTHSAPREDDSTASSTGGTRAGLDEDAIFDVLQANRRRVALRSLHEEGEESSVGELAERIAAAENGVDRSAVRPAQRKRVYVALYQNHLPKLADHGVVDYDRDVGLVRLREPARAVLPYLYFDPVDDSSPVGDRCSIAAFLRYFRRLVRR